jgi:sporulation protein YpjB
MFKLCVRSMLFKCMCMCLLWNVIGCGLATMLVVAQTPHDQREPSKINDKLDSPKINEKLMWYANQLLEHAEDVTSATAITAIDQMASMIVEVKVDESHSWEALTVLLDLMIQAKRTFHAVSPSLVDRKQKAMQVHFAIDAYIHRYHPLWLQFEKPLKRNLAKVKSLMEKQQFEQAQVAFREFQQQLNLIHAAMQITSTSSQVSKLDSLLLFLQHEFSHSPFAKVQFRHALDVLNQTLDDMFHIVQSKPTAAQSMEKNQLVTGIVSIGGFIIVILMIAAYRMKQKHQSHPRKT